MRSCFRRLGIQRICKKVGLIDTLLRSEARAEEIELSLCANNKRGGHAFASAPRRTVQSVRFVPLSFSFSSTHSYRLHPQ
jgi:hypothetical protein